MMPRRTTVAEACSATVAANPMNSSKPMRRRRESQRSSDGSMSPRVAALVLFAALYRPRSNLVEAFSELKQRQQAAPVAFDAIFPPFRCPSVLWVSTSVVPEDGSSYQSYDSSTTSKISYQGSLSAIQKLHKDIKDWTRQRNHVRALEAVSQLFNVMQTTSHLGSRERLELGAALDIGLQEFVVSSLASKDASRVMHAVEAMNEQLACAALPRRYRTIPRSTVIAAIHALTGLSIRSDRDTIRCPLDESFRWLQRLVTGTGVRTESPGRHTKRPALHEREFVQVLHAFCKAGDMTMAHRIVALQERTPHAPPLSAASYSVLLAAYGRRHDVSNVQTVLQRAHANRIQPDIVMLNTLIDAYINCHDMVQAQRVFAAMNETNVTPNRRTYNIILKGWAKQGNLVQAQSLAMEMKQLHLWDSITTNTLVDAAVHVGDFAYAEHVLEVYTMHTSKQYPTHPNVPAYTELIDAYCKSDQLDRALAVWQTMRKRHVDPNEVTYTCLMSGFGHHHKVDLALKMLEYMETQGMRPTTRLYNALVAGLVTDVHPTELDYRVDDAMKVLRHMMRVSVRPNAYTVALLVDALGKCRVPRITEAKLLVDKLEQQKTIAVGNVKVVTALIRTCGRNGDIQDVLHAFQKLETPDSVAVNAFMDSCCRCNQDKLALQAFELYYGKKTMIPDVISYSVLIGSGLKVSSTASRRQARTLYQEMKARKIYPDHGLVDVILKAMIRDGASRSLGKLDVQFMLTVIKDAEALEWADEQLDRRKRAVRSVLDGARDAWRSTDMPEIVANDALFARKGWNQVDSGFRLWGGGSAASAKPTLPNACTFLESHGWNNVDSGFRLF